MKKNQLAKKERAERRRNLARAIDLTWSSLRSHLADAVTRRDNHYGNEEFHARATREYSEVIYSLSVELEAVTKQDFKREYDVFRERI